MTIKLAKLQLLHIYIILVILNTICLRANVISFKMMGESVLVDI